MTDNYAKTSDGYANVKNAILRQAAEDYKRALRRGDQQTATALERWFKSDWGEFLSNNNGAYIIQNVRKEIKNNV